MTEPIEENQSPPTVPAKTPPKASAKVPANAPVYPDAEWLQVESLDLDAQGVAHKADGMVVFIEGALPFEEVQFNVHRRKNNWEQGTVTAIRRESSQRVRPGCPHFGLHDGRMRRLQDAAPAPCRPGGREAARARRQPVAPGQGAPREPAAPIEGPAWHYRWRARLRCAMCVKKGAGAGRLPRAQEPLRGRHQVCHVLPKQVSDMLMPLRALIGSMDARETCPQIELACGDAPGSTSRHDRAGAAALGAAVARRHRPLRLLRAEAGVQWWLQAKGPDTVKLLEEGGTPLAYQLPEFGITMPFRPTDFTQVNPHINRVLVGKALRLLDVQSHERVIDWFCGLGNFTLPLASRGREVLGIEGSEALVARATRELQRNQQRPRVVPWRRHIRGAQPVRDDASHAGGRRQRRQVAGRPAARRCFRACQGLADLHQHPSCAPAAGHRRSASST
jgi:23S rRNA (uracil1939-C5)-methyltransferase